MDSRTLVKDTLNFCNTAGRAPRQLWRLPWAELHHPGAVERVLGDFPEDITACPVLLTQRNPMTRGDQFAAGTYVDDWGCVFENIQPGVVGEVKAPIIPWEDEDWRDCSPIHIPEDWLSLDVDQINAFCRQTDQFVLSGLCPRPFEQLQFIRGTEQLYVDLMEQPQGLLDFLERMHGFYCQAVELWCRTDVDAIQFMDDWGSQKSLLINPALWRQLFRPLYQDYIDIAHCHGKKIFMHSDGHILQILPDLVEMGLDAVNCQMFCMGVENLEQFRGKITFWGEIDRQNLLPFGSTGDISDAVRQVADHLWEDGGCIAQCEFGPGAKPENVYEVFRAWSRILPGGQGKEG